MIDMSLFAFPAYLKNLKDTRKPGGPQEGKTWEAFKKTNFVPQTVRSQKKPPTGEQVKPKAYLRKAVTPWAIDPRFCISGDYCRQELPKVDNDLITC